MATVKEQVVLSLTRIWCDLGRDLLHIVLYVPIPDQHWGWLCLGIGLSSTLTWMAVDFWGSFPHRPGSTLSQPPYQLACSTRGVSSCQSLWCSWLAYRAWDGGDGNTSYKHSNSFQYFTGVYKHINSSQGAHKQTNTFILGYKVYH